MTGFSKKTIDTYIRNRIQYWIYDFGRNAHLYLKEELQISTDDKEKLTADDKFKINEFQRQIRDTTIVTGGSICSMLLGEQPNDLDIYLTDKKIASLIAWYYLNKMKAAGNLKETTYIPRIDVLDTDDGIHIYLKSQGITGEGIDSENYQYFEQGPENDIDNFFKEYRKTFSKEEKLPAYTVRHITSNAITLSNDIQIITRFTGAPEEIHSNFDFIHATNYWTWEEGVVYNPEALAATLEKRLYYFGSRFPVASIFRMRKFIERGWRISGGEMLKIAFDISKLDLTDVNVLRQQSIGMDSAYFAEVIDKIRDKKDIDRTYLFQCIDEVFRLNDKKDNFLEYQEDSLPSEEVVDLQEGFILTSE